MIIFDAAQSREQLLRIRDSMAGKVNQRVLCERFEDLGDGCVLVLNAGSRRNRCDMHDSSMFTETSSHWSLRLPYDQKPMLVHDGRVQWSPPTNANEGCQVGRIRRNTKIGERRLAFPKRSGSMQWKKGELGSRAPPDARSTGIVLLKDFRDWEGDSCSTTSTTSASECRGGRPLWGNGVFFFFYTMQLSIEVHEWKMKS